MSTFTVRATDSGTNTATRQYTLTIGAATVTGGSVSRMSGGMGSGNTGSAIAGTTVQLAFIATFSDGTMQTIPSGVIRTSSDPTKATVDATGRVSMLSLGTVTITAMYMGQTITFTLTLTAPGTGGLMPNPAPVVRPNDVTAPAAPIAPAPPTRTAAPGGGIGAQGVAGTPLPAPPMR